MLMTVVWFSFFCSCSCGNLSVSAASTGFRSYFVKSCATCVLWRNELHGQAPGDGYMERVPSNQPNHPWKGTVNEGQRQSQPKSSMVARLCFEHVNVTWHIPQLTKTPAHLEIIPETWIQQLPLQRFNRHDDSDTRSRLKGSTCL